jgi:hypothetical protein
LEIVAPHEEEQRCHEKFAILWFQYILIDATQVVQLGDEIELGKNVKPAALGTWAHFSVGGVRMRCRENERIKWDLDTCFCREKLTGIRQVRQCDGVNKVPRSTRKHGRTESHMQFRPVDWETLMTHQHRLLDWIDSYAGRPTYREPELLVTEHSWDHYTPRDSRQRTPSRKERREIVC